MCVFVSIKVRLLVWVSVIMRDDIVCLSSNDKKNEDKKMTSSKTTSINDRHSGDPREGFNWRGDPRESFNWWSRITVGNKRTPLRQIYQRWERRYPRWNCLYQRWEMKRRHVNEISPRKSISYDVVTLLFFLLSFSRFFKISPHFHSFRWVFEWCRIIIRRFAHWFIELVLF